MGNDGFHIARYGLLEIQDRSPSPTSTIMRSLLGKEPKYDEVGRRIDRRKKEESSSDEANEDKTASCLSISS